jgi:hypothetical protein
MAQSVRISEERKPNWAVPALTILIAVVLLLIVTAFWPRPAVAPEKQLQLPVVPTTPNPQVGNGETK